MEAFYRAVLVIGDNVKVMTNIREIITKTGIETSYAYACSPGSSTKPMIGQSYDVKRDTALLISRFDLIISAHCQQIFPRDLVEGVKCINIHPGYNPFNRGWYPHVHSILNKLPAGVTIHEMDESIDHGPIIARQEVEVHSWDTSETLYERVLEAEKELLDKHLTSILLNRYALQRVTEPRSFYSRQDYEDLRHIDLEKSYKGREFIDRLRALTHGNLNNAFFYDESGEKIFIRIVLERGNC